MDGGMSGTERDERGRDRGMEGRDGRDLRQTDAGV